MAIERAVAWAYLPFFEGGVVMSGGGAFCQLLVGFFHVWYAKLET